MRVETRTAVEHGQALFSDPKVGNLSFNEQHCALCHGLHDGDSSALLSGAPLAGVLRRSHFWGGSELTLVGAINSCRYYFMGSDQDWTGEEVEARAIYAYLESLPADEADESPWPFTVAPLAELTPLDSGQGRDLYQRACSSCHGAKGSGQGRVLRRAPILPNDTLTDHPFGEYTAAERRLVFVEKIRHGGFLGYGGQMPPFSAEALTDEDIAALLGFLQVP